MTAIQESISLAQDPYVGHLASSAKSNEENWLEALKLLMSYFDQSKGVASPHGRGTTELIGKTMVFDTSKNPFVRSKMEVPNVRRYLAGELWWYFSGSDRLEDIEPFSSFQKQASNDGISLNSAYGARLLGTHRQSQKHFNGFNQFDYAAECIARDADSRQAVMHINNILDSIENVQLGYKTKDYPCTLNLHYLMRNNKLHMIVGMRSQDIFRGYLYDIPLFMFMQAYVLGKLKQKDPRFSDVEMGLLIDNMHSVHLYERNLNEAREFLQNLPTSCLHTEGDWKGFFHDSNFAANLEAYARREAGFTGSHAHLWQRITSWREQQKAKGYGISNDGNSGTGNS